MSGERERGEAEHEPAPPEAAAPTDSSDEDLAPSPGGADGSDASAAAGVTEAGEAAEVAKAAEAAEATDGSSPGEGFRWKPLAVASLIRLLRPVDIASLAYFRIAFGAILFWEVWRFVEADWIKRYFIDPSFHFTYYGFGWVAPLPGKWMYVFFAAMFLVTGAFTLGYRYRVAAPMLFAGVTYWFLLDAARYLNHFYLVCLLAFIMMFVPANRIVSMDVAAGRVERSDYAPTWSLWLVRFQLAVVYVYGAVAKMGSDWVRGQPMAEWLARRTDFPLLGEWFTEPWMVLAFAWGGLLFDLLIVPALLWRRTRWFAFAAVIFFHASNDILWNIGIFPWLGIHSATIFFAPDWPRRLLAAVGVQARRLPVPTLAPGSIPRKAVVVLLAVFIVFNLFMPLRHHFYDGDVNWTDEGHRWSWRMKLRDKDANVMFEVRDPQTGEEWSVDPDDNLPSWQANVMETRPDMIHEYAIHLADGYRAERGYRVEVRADATASLHGRPWQPLLDPTVDIGNIPRGLGERDWIVPLQHPMPDPFAVSD